MVGRFVGVTLMVDDIEDEYNRLVHKGRRIHRAPRKAETGAERLHT
jgi:hypothetical protein